MRDVALQAWIALVNVNRTSLVRGGLSSRRRKAHHETAARRTCSQLAAHVPGLRAAPFPLLRILRYGRYAGTALGQLGTIQMASVDPGHEMP